MRDKGQGTRDKDSRGNALSILIPVGPGEMAWEGLLEQLPIDHPGLEIILSATDSPPDRLRKDVTWHVAPPGRGKQLNRSAAQAEGDWLWFLHADSRLHFSTLDAVLAFTRLDKPALGYCDLRFLNDGPWLTHLNALGANLRSRWFGLPYGDQGLCLPKAWFERLGGFVEDLERGEDLNFVVRARKAGLPIRPIETSLYTSARRYREAGWLRTTWRHQVAAWRLVRDA